MKAIVLAGGHGTKLWPYSVVRNKAMVPVANRPLIRHIMDAASAAHGDAIDGWVVVAGPHAQQLIHEFRDDEDVQVIPAGDRHGSAFSLLAAAPAVQEQDCLVLYADVLLLPEQIEKLIQSHQASQCTTMLTCPVREGAHGDCIHVEIADGRAKRIIAHPIDPVGEKPCGFLLRRDIWPFIRANSGLFTSVDVGMMPPDEGYLEMSLQDYMERGYPVNAVSCGEEVIDVDRPWDIMAANALMVERICGKMTDNQLGEGARIDATAFIDGHVHLGRGSVIGRNVICRGNVVVGDHTEITDGAIIQGNAIIGSHCRIREYCQVGENTVIGNRCVVGHGAEFSGVCFENAYFYHYMEYWGLVGANVDFGAATVCGTLRFANDDTVQLVKGRKERPRRYANCVYMGDYSRTGVNAILMPGVKVGVNSIVGAGVLLDHDLPDRKIVFTRQEQVIKDWSSDRYGW